MPENAAAEGGFGRDAPSRPDDNDRGGAREDKESKAEKAETFDRAMDNANRPDRAAAAGPPDKEDDTKPDKPDRDDRVAGPPGVGAPPSTSEPDETEKENEPDARPGGEERGFFDRVVDTLTAPPTDAEGNARSTTPVSDRIRNHTVNYSIDDLRNVFSDDPGLTPEQSKALANGAAVIDGVVTPAPTTPREQLSLYQSDLRLQQRGLEYQRAQLGENPHPRSPNAGRAAAIDRELERLAERRELVETVARPDLATGAVPEILHFDPKDDGRMVVAHGDIGNASHIAVMVPGMTTDLENFKTTDNRAKELMAELSRRPGVSDTAVISYLGYDAPDDLTEAVFDDQAVEGAAVFADFLSALPEEAEVHVLAHSYGSRLTGEALAEGARPDYAHVFGSPGIGVDTLDELNLEGKTVVTVTSNPGDRVVTFGPFGEMPPEGAISYPAMGDPPPEGSPEMEDYEPHVDYFDSRILAEIITGERKPITVEE